MGCICSSWKMLHDRKPNRAAEAGLNEMLTFSINIYFPQYVSLAQTQSPVSQSAPVKPAGQTQVKLATWSTHSPPFRQGRDSHSFTSAG